MAKTARWTISMAIILSLLLTGCGQGEEPDPQDQLDELQQRLSVLEQELSQMGGGQELVEHQLVSLEGSLSQLRGDLDLFQRQLTSPQSQVGEAIVERPTVPLRVPGTATRVVAASNSSFLGRMQADYVCDGVDDHVELQAAVDALPSGGGKVLLLEGTFTIGASIELGDYTTMEGQGFGTVIRIEDAHNGAIDMVTNRGAAGGGNTGIVISNLRLDGNRNNNDEATQRGVLLAHVSYSLVNRVLAENFWDFGIGFWGSDNDYNIVTENIVRNCHNSGSDKGNIYLDEFRNGIVSDNVMYGNTGAGVTAPTALLVICGGSHTTVTGNILHDSSEVGIRIFSSDNLVISGNSIYDTGTDAIRLEYSIEFSTISDNAIWDSEGKGIYLYSNDSKQNVISGNTIHLHRHGIYLDGAHHNTITGNNIGWAGAANYDGIFLVDSEHNLIEGNSVRKGIYDLQRYGINISNAGSGGNIVLGNDLYDSGSISALNNAGAGTVIKNNNGYNPVGTSSIAVGASPFTYTAGASPETVYVGDGTVSRITKGGNSFGLTSGSFELEAYESIVVTYTAAPTMYRDAH